MQWIKPSLTTWFYSAMLLLPVGAKASPVLDQFYDPAQTNLFSEARDVDYRGQTFTIGVTGQLDSISIPLGYNQSVPEQISFFLAPIVSNEILFSQAFELTIPSTDASSVYYGTGPGLADWTSLNFEPFNIEVSAGEQFALVFDAPVSIAQTEQLPIPIQIGWFASADDSYLGGTGIAVTSLSDQAVSSGSWDQDFATYITPTPVPEPASWTMMLGGLVGFTFIVRRTRRKQSC